MLIKDYIKILQKLEDENPNSVVIKRSDNFEMNGSYVEAFAPIEGKKYKVERQTFRDAFDGETYTAKVYVPNFSKDDKDDINVIIL